MKKRILCILVTVLACLSLLWISVLAEGEVSYVDTDGTVKSVTEYTVIDSDTLETLTLTNDWYALEGSVTVSERVQVDGDVNLILCDGATLMAIKGVHVSGSNSLTIWGQTAGSGELTVEKADSYCAGIGGDRREASGAITINGGTVTVNGYALAAGIGSGLQGQTGTITVNGGMVYARGGLGAAGIGNSYESTGGTITINGGTVIGVGGDGVSEDNGAGAGIGGSEDGAGCDVFIYGGTVFAVRGAGNGGEAIGCGEGGTGSGSLTLYEDAVVYTTPEAQEPVTQDARLGACRGGYVKITLQRDPISYAEADGTVKSCRNFLPLEGTEVYLVPGWYALTQDLSYGHRIWISGDVHLILGDGCTLEALGGIQLAVGNSLTIWSQTEGTGTLRAEAGGWNNAGIGGGGGGSSESDLNAGALTVNGGVITANGYGGAGIGGGSYEEQTGENELLYIGGEGGAVTINGGTVTATGYNLAAGIGGSDWHKGGTVTINGGIVTATGGEGGAGIGGGYTASSDPITINGGTVTAIGGRESAGIGGGMRADGCTVTITGGSVTAVGGSEYNFDDSFASASGQGGAGIGGGMIGNGGDVTITGGIVSATGGSGGAGIGGGSGNCVDFTSDADKKGGDGGTVTITGGYVIACGGISNPNEHGHGAPGIGGGARATNYYGTYVNGGAGADVEITGGTVIAIAGSSSVEAIGHAENSSDSGSLALPGSAIVYASPEAAPAAQSDRIAACRGTWVRITSGEEAVSYLDPDGTEQVRQQNFTHLSGAGAGILTGWYAVTEDTVYDSLMTVVGDAHIILCDGAELTTRGINVDEGNSLTIWSQAAGTGALTSIARKGDNAAIGSGHVARYPYDSGTITINGGRITADATQSRGAGIGGTILRSNGTVIINGGTVTAISTYGAGIGGGHAGGGGGTVIINGGTVTASSTYGAGIGGGRGRNDEMNGHQNGGDGGNITINGGAVTATGGWWAAGIGGATGTGDSSTTEDGGTGGTVTINGGIVYAYGANRAAGIGGANGAAGGTVTINGGTVVAVRGGSRDAQAIGHGEHAEDSGSLTLSDEAEVYTSASSKEPVDEEARLDACRGAWAKIAPPKPEVFYVDTDGTEKTVQWYGILGETDTTLTTGWYVLADDTVCSDRITVSGDVRLILEDGAHLTAESGITVTGSNSLTIYGQTGQTGALTATSVKDAAAIGGGANSGGGTITITGGIVTADASGGYGAGIGGGGATSGSYKAGDGGTVTITGGTVTASGGFWAAGIGGGTGTGNSNTTANGGNGGTVTITGGEVFAYGANRAAGIGGANGAAGGTVTISGGTVIAVRGGSADAQAIGHGERATDSGSLSLYDDAWAFSSETAETTAAWQERADICRGAWVRIAPGMSCITYVDADGSETKCNDYTVLNGAESVLSEGWYVLAEDQTYTERLETSGDVRLILGDGAAWKAEKGVNVASGSQLTLYGQSGQTGKLTVSDPGANYAGIGGGEGQDAGTVTINGGVVAVTSGTNSAGIGGASGQAAGTVVINGGKVTVISGTQSAAIGSGSRGTGGTVTINGGTVIANGMNNGAGIGGGYQAAGGEITITGGTILATGSTYGAAIGGGGSGAGGTIHIEGGSIRASVSREGGQAIGHGVGSEDSGSLSLAEGIAVFNQLLVPASVPQDERIEACRGSWVQIVSDPDSTTFVDADGSEQTCNNYTFLSGTETTLSSGWYLITGQLSSDARITVSGDVWLILADDAEFTAQKGLNVAGTNSLTIYGQSAQTGTLRITEPDKNYAGIGGGANQNGGTVTINGGVIETNGGMYGAGIGGGYGTGTNGGGAGGIITINGGTVIATGGNYGAGIGGGTGSANVAESAAGGVITINGGTVIATGGNGGSSSRGASGIGGGYNGGGGEIAITGGSVTAIAGSNAEAVGHGWNSEDSGTLTLGCVKAYTSDDDGAQPVESAQRNASCRGQWVKLEPCDHADAVYTDNGDGTHTASCLSCGEETTEAHSFIDHTCICGADDLPLKILQQPADASVLLGETASTTVIAEGEGLKYQWYGREVNGREFTSGLKGDTYSVALVKSKIGRQVWCVITDKYGNSVTTRTATLGVAYPEDYVYPCITQQPADCYVEPGETASVTIAAEGTGELTYQWYFQNQGTDPEKWSRSDIKGVDADTYFCAMNATRNGRTIYCVVTDAWGNSVQTDCAVIGYDYPDGYEAPRIVTQPADVFVDAGELASTSLVAEGTELTYQWYLRANENAAWSRSSLKGDTYSVTMIPAKSGRQVKCVVTDKYGAKTETDIVTLTMVIPEEHAEGPRIVSQPTDITVANGEVASTTVVAEGAGLTYQWYGREANGREFRSSLKTDTYSVKMIPSKSGRQVWCVITDKYGRSVTTEAVTLAMEP